MTLRAGMEVPEIHELAITESLLGTVLKHAAQSGGERVVTINLQVGELRDLSEEWIQRYFDYLSKGTAAEGAKIMVRTIPATIECRECSDQFSADIRKGDSPCPRCSSTRVRVCGGDEFVIESIGVI